MIVLTPKYDEHTSEEAIGNAFIVYKNALGDGYEQYLTGLIKSGFRKFN